jgi:hypothetical protein
MAQKPADPLKDKLDTLALAILDEMMTDAGEVKDAIPQSAQKALDVVKTLGGWYAIKNKVNPEVNEEGKGIHEFQNRLASADQGGEGRDDRGTTADAANIDAAARGHGYTRRGRSRSGGTNGGNLQPVRAPSPRHHSSAGADDNDNGGEELARFVARVPGGDGSAPDGQHGTRGPSYVAGRGFNSGAAGVEDARGADDDSLID